MEKNRDDNAGDSYSSSSDESNGSYGATQPDLNKSPTSMLPRSQGMETASHGSAHNNHRIRGGISLMNNEAPNDYPFPTSNLPPHFRLDSSSSLQLPQTEQGNWSGSSLANTNRMNWQQHFAQITPTHEPAATNLGGSQDLGFQALLNQVIASDNFHVNQNHHRPIQPRKMSGQEEPNLQFMNWMSSRQGANPRQNIGVSTASTSRSKVIENKVYDPTYAAVGLPVDPHLRMFQASHFYLGAKNKDKK